MDADIIIQKIIEKTGMSFDDVNRKILNKRQELSNLVSKDGAAYILAKELGLDLFEKTKRRLEIKNVVAGIKNLNINARVQRIFPAREFEYKGRKSKVANIILGDQSGTIRMSLWDTQISLLDKLKQGQAVEIFGAYTRDNRGTPEIRLSRRGGINVLEDSDLPSVSAVDIKRINIANLKDSEKYELRAAIVQIFNTNLLYEMCPECKSRVKKDDDGFVCKEHGKVEPEYLVVLNGVIDDGTGNVRTVFFRENALKIMGIGIDDLKANGTGALNEENILGKEYVFQGSLRKNKMFNKSEFVVSDIKNVNVKSEANRIIGDLGAKK